MSHSNLRRVHICVPNGGCNCNGHFHQWIQKENVLLAVVELDNGKVIQVDYEYIQFYKD
ncbi:hypothetical protein KKF82_06565 [Patescibacteria group bacterium]|nr:hypothetical protein [Patescibacteria group bacterium]